MSTVAPGLAPAPVPGKAEAVIETTTQTFTKDVLDESRKRPVLVDFWAPWCGPCRTLGPIIEKAVAATGGAVRLVKMNIDDHPSIAGQLGIQSIPAVIAFSNGQPVDGFMGALPESQVISFLERLTKGKIGGEEKDLLKTADEALVGGNPAAAAELYAQLLAEDSANIHALAGLARCYVETGALDKAKDGLTMLGYIVAGATAVADKVTALKNAISGWFV